MALLLALVLSHRTFHQAHVRGHVDQNVRIERVVHLVEIDRELPRHAVQRIAVPHRLERRVNTQERRSMIAGGLTRTGRQQEIGALAQQGPLASGGDLRNRVKQTAVGQSEVFGSDDSQDRQGGSTLCLSSVCIRDPIGDPFLATGTIGKKEHADHRAARHEIGEQPAAAKDFVVEVGGYDQNTARRDHRRGAHGEQQTNGRVSIAVHSR